MSSTESEYISLSQALRRVIPTMELIKELKERGYNVGDTTPEVKHTLFEDNSGALTLAKAPAMRPRTKHINVKYHHFRSSVAKGEVEIESVGTDDQAADYLTKMSDEVTFKRHRMTVQGW